MEASIEGHSAVLLALVREIHAQPQALVGPLEARLNEELAGVNTRVRDKIQELRAKVDALHPQEEAARGEVQRGEDMAQEDLVEERLKDPAERRAAECEEEGSLSITEVNAQSSDGFDSKKRATRRRKRWS
jgi:signal transduction histidine kinase